MSRFVSAIMGPRLSMGWPMPLKVLPRMSMDRATSMGWPVSLVAVLVRDIFSVLSNTWIIALSS